MKFEEKLSKAKDNTIEKLCWDVACREEEEEWIKGIRTRDVKEKRESLEKAGWSVKAWNEELRRGNIRSLELTGKVRERTREETNKEIEKSKYAEEIRVLERDNEDVYLKSGIKKSKNGLEVLARFRMGNEARACFYWKKEEEKKCRMCKKEKETIKHVLIECELTGDRSRTLKEQLNGDRKSLSRLSQILWWRKRREKEEGREITDAP